ncbi:PA14 domain-containing protein [Caldifermentibacillus hisashii]|uniref:PA14 domain-containing protein n=1 Tax=Caldifermentibacillus hisashii TaxID=996558 RepID=UPI0031FBDE9C
MKKLNIFLILLFGMFLSIIFTQSVLAETLSSAKWKAEYYLNVNFQGTPIKVEYNQLDFDWKNASPDSRVPGDYFSARFSKTFTLDEDSIINFKAWADDRVRVYLDGKLIINAWENSYYRLRGDSINTVNKGKHTMVVEYYEETGGAALKFTADLVPTFKKETDSVHYNWGQGGPSGVPTDNFAAIFNQSDTFDGKEYFAQTFADDRVRMKVNGDYKIDSWTDSSGNINRAILGTLSGQQSIQTEYYENRERASIYSDIVPFGDWLVYYYNNTNLSDHPVNAEVIEANSDGSLNVDNGSGSPISKVGADNFSAKYVTAKRIDEGDYILRTARDDGIRVYIDGELVLDRWNASSRTEEAVKVNVKNKGGSNIHWIEIQYFEVTGESTVEFSLEPYKIPTDKWIGEIYPTADFKGNPIIVESNQINYQWGNNSPKDGLPNDWFTARFSKSFILSKDTMMNFKAWADDRVRVYLDGELVINAWNDSHYDVRGDVAQTVKKGTHTIVVEYYEASGQAALKFTDDIIPTFTQKIKNVHYNWGYSSPQGIPNDRFLAVFDQSDTFDGKEYFAQTFADDRVRMKVNGDYKIDSWTDSSGNINRAILGTLSGQQSIQTEYYENRERASIYSDIVPFGDWLVYYYNNTNLSDHPVNAEVIEANSDGSLNVDNGSGSPISKVGADNFSAKYVTAKRIDEGDYILRTARDDGIRVYIDGELVLDRWNASSRTEEAVKVNVKNKGGSNIHWIEIQYFEVTGESTVEFSLEPYKIPTDKWIGEIYPTADFKGNPIIVESNQINYQWGNNSPKDGLPNDWFTARFSKSFILSKDTMMNFKAWADDRVRVYLDGELVINAWNDSHYDVRGDVAQTVKKGTHTIVVEYYEASGQAALKFEDKQISTLFTKTSTVHNNWGSNSPSGLPTDNFAVIFDQSKPYDGKEYFAQTFADDRIRMKVNGDYKIDRWTDSSGEINRIILGTLSGSQNIQTEYYENTGQASVYSDIVPFGDWLVYYYNNTNLEGHPVNAEVISSNTDGSLKDNNGTNSPIDKINKDNYSARYTTAKRINAGDYIIRTIRDDGIRVYIDGNLVLDRWKSGNKTEDAVKLNVQDKDGSNIHWIEVEYYEGSGVSTVEFNLEPYTVPADKWLGEIYPQSDFQGTPSIIKSDNLSFIWNTLSPVDGVPADNFTARFQRYVDITEDGLYKLNISADDGVRVYVDDKIYIDSWQSSSGFHPYNYAKLSKGEHLIKVEYFEGTGAASINFNIEKVNYNYYEKANDVFYNWQTGSPSSNVPVDNFTALFDQSRIFDGNEYFAVTYADDGVRFLLDNQVKIDRWSNSSGTIDKTYLGNLSGYHNVETQYMESSERAFIFSNVIPINNWAAYYYNNTNLEGQPASGTVIVAGSNEDLYQDYGASAPMQNVNSDNFSARYITAKHLSSGYHTIEAKADDGIRILVDGKVIYERWTSNSTNTDIINFYVENNNGSDIHWIEVQYMEQTGNSNVSVQITSTDRVVFNTYYDITLSDAVNMQMNTRPQTDQKYAYIRKDMVENNIVTAYPYANVRKGPGTNYADIGDAKYGSYVNIVGELNGWYAIEFNHGTWVHALAQDVQNNLNPNNFSEGSNEFFQFLSLSQSANVDVSEINSKILSGKGILNGKGQAFVEAGKKYGINEIYLISHALLETGNGTSTLAKGVVYNGQTVYNMYGINAVDSNSTEEGARYAYEHGWFTPETAIIEGAKFIAVSYINRGQDTLYKMRWNPKAMDDYGYASHQYATDIRWAVKQVNSIRQIYNLLSHYTLVFDVPRYK